ncbi:MAG TPA: serine/threonine-protein kinase [Candidatus Xenobia bacterium]
MVLLAGGIWWWRRRSETAAAPPAPDNTPTIGGYRLEAQVGSGSAAVLYRGRKPGSPEVAIKVLHLTDPQDPRHFIQRFEREVEILKGLSHPGIVRFLDAGEENGRLFLVEELAPQGSLRQVLTADGLPPARFRQLFTALCEAISYAHGTGVVHRDLKPENVVMVDETHLKITDFGLARSEFLGAFTTTATTLGTPVYMAPEQCAGRPATAAADQYSLGILGYEMWNGDTPFSGHMPDLLIRHLYDNPPPFKRPCPELEQLLHRMLAKEPTERFASLDEVLAVLSRIPLG